MRVIIKWEWDLGKIMCFVFVEWFYFEICIFWKRIFEKERVTVTMSFCHFELCSDVVTVSCGIIENDIGGYGIWIKL